MTRCDHFGRWLQRQIEGLEIPRAEFCRRHGFSVDTMNKWVAMPHPALRGHHVVKLARALGTSREVIEQKLAEATGTAPVAAA